MRRRLLLALIPALVGGCGGASPTEQVVRRYALNLDANYKDVVAQLAALKAAVDQFVAGPSAAGQLAAQQAWLAARPVYAQAEISRFYGGPLDQAQGAMNEWPIDENFIDYTSANPNGGIINDPQDYPQLTPGVLAMSDEKGGLENLSTGFHAIELLLWGQRADQTQGPGTRPYTDFVDGGTAQHQDRRRTYLSAATELLLSNMQSVESQWDLSDQLSYASTLVAAAPLDSLAKITRGMTNLAVAELYYERLSDPYVTQARKDEESCFSEATDLDLKGNALGVENVYLGRYAGLSQTLSGPSLSDLVKAKAPTLDGAIKQQLTMLRAALDAIPTPFDHSVLAPATSDAHLKVKAAIDAGAPLQGLFEQMVAALGVTVNI
jgi:putative iron-regulated protein